MCGIIGYKGNKNAVEIVIEGLKRLEYRGYDSWGMAWIDKRGLNILKKVGKIGKIECPKDKNSNIAMGHTRWATHGGVTKLNAHPHHNETKSVAVVHNGIIENYQELKKELAQEGHKLVSETDTEVLPHLIESYLEKYDLEEAVARSIKRLKGSYALIAMSKESKKLVAARSGSPLVVGVGKNEFFIASDVPAFINYTKDVIFLDDDELIVFNDDLKIYDINNMSLKEKEISKIDWNVEKAMKGSFDHFMLKEITEQNDTIVRALNQDDKKIMDVAREINSSYGTFFVACGSSYHAALTASYLFSRIAKKHINVVLASEFPSYEHFLTEKTLMIPISQSGETADVLEAVKAAKKKGVKVLSIVNVMGSSLMRASDHTFLMNAGPEICVLSTKSYTSQLAILTLLAYACVDDLDQGKEELLNAASHTEEFFEEKFMKHLEDLAVKIKDNQHIFVIGRSLNYPTALEAALKIKEVSYIHAEGFAGGELKHGTIALIEPGTPCFVFVANDEAKNETISNAMEIKSRGGYIIGVSPENNEIFDFHIKVAPDHNTSPILNIIPVQLLAYYLAVKLGCDPDKPRNLAKSVTVK